LGTLSLKIKINSRLYHKYSDFSRDILINVALNIKKTDNSKIKEQFHIGSCVIKGILDIKQGFWRII